LATTIAVIVARFGVRHHGRMRAVLFLDVDGPLIPFGTRPASCPNTVPDPVDTSGNPLLHRLDPTVGRRLLALGCDLVWATTWAADANEAIALHRVDVRCGLMPADFVTIRE
jgi:hypothetical protein